MTPATKTRLVAGLIAAAVIGPAAAESPSAPAETRPTIAPPPPARSAVLPLPSDAGRVLPTIPGQLTPEDDYRIGPQDLLEIEVYAIEGLKREVRVNARGVISLPLIGPIVVGGLTGQEAEALIASKYAQDYLQDPQVSLFIKEFTSQRITIEGAVNKPGVYPIRGQTTLLQAIAIAGGQGSLSDMNEVMLFRAEKGEKKTLKYDVIKIRAGEIEDPVLANDDLVVVKRSQTRVAIKDSVFRDVFDMLNPFSYLRP